MADRKNLGRTKYLFLFIGLNVRVWARASTNGVYHMYNIWIIYIYVYVWYVSIFKLNL